MLFRSVVESCLDPPYLCRTCRRYSSLGSSSTQRAAQRLRWLRRVRCAACSALLSVMTLSIVSMLASLLMIVGLSMALTCEPLVSAPLSQCTAYETRALTLSRAPACLA